MEHVCEFSGSDAYCNGDLKREASAVDIRLDLMTLKSKLSDPEECTTSEFTYLLCQVEVGFGRDEY